MRKRVNPLTASTMVAAALCRSAQAWDSCGYGSHRNVWGRCHSNCGPKSGRRPGYHVGFLRLQVCPQRYSLRASHGSAHLP
jgi:hypothetical protein